MARTTREQELARLAKRNRGVLRPLDVVRFARNPRTALHAAFEWDDTVAAEQYRLEQARHIIRAHVTIVECGDCKVATRAYVSLESERGVESYRTIRTVLRSRSRRKELLEQAKRDMRAFREKYAVLTELADVFTAMSRATGDAA